MRHRAVPGVQGHAAAAGMLAVTVGDQNIHERR